MYGILLESIVTFIKKVYSEEKWELIRKSARVDQENFSAHQVYAETIIPRIVDACNKHLGLPKEDILISFGKTYVDFISHYGYDKILKVVGRNFRDFLNGLDNIHEYLRFSYPKLKPPSFFCEQESRQGLVLHYRSRRRYDGFTYYVMGIVKSVGRTFYKQDISVSIIKQETTGNMVHVTYQLSFDNSAYFAEEAKTENTQNLPLRMDVFYDLFPFHILFDREMIIRSIGKSLRATVDEICGYDVTQVFSLKKPLVDFSWDAVIGRTNTMFELATIDPIRGREETGEEDESYTWTDTNGKKRTSVVSISQDDDSGTFLRLKGQMLYVREWESILFLGTAVLQDLDALSQTGLYLNDLSMHDNSRDLVLAGAQQGVEMKLILKQEQSRTKQLDDTLRQLESERHRSKELMYKMLPKPLANALMARSENKDVELTPNDVVDLAQQATLFVCAVQLVDLGQQAADSPQSDNLQQLIQLQRQMEMFAERFGYYKIETSRNHFMAASGIPTGTEVTEENACFLAKKVYRFAAGLSRLRVSMAVCTGPTVYAVIGSRFPRLCLFGQTVATATQMIELCKPTENQPQILVSESTRAKLPKDSGHKFTAGPPVSGKDKDIKTYVLQQ